MRGKVEGAAGREVEERPTRGILPHFSSSTFHYHNRPPSPAPFATVTPPAPKLSGCGSYIQFLVAVCKCASSGCPSIFGSVTSP